MGEKYFQNSMLPREEVAPAQKAADSERAAYVAKEENLEDVAETGKTESETEKESTLEMIKVMEEARSERLGILGDVFSRLKNSMEVAREKIGISKLREKIDDKLPKPAQEFLSQVMDVSSLKMYAEAGSGRNLIGEKLQPKDRILAALSGGTNDIAKALFAYAASSGSAEYAQLGSVLYGTSWALLLKKNGKEMMRNLQELAHYYNVNSTRLVLARIEETFYKYRYPGFEGRFEPINN